MTDVYYNGKFIGETDASQKFIKSVKEKRRSLEVPQELSIKYTQELDSIFIETDTGRVLRPLIVVENGQSKLKNEHLVAITKNELNWNDLIKLGIIEYVDAAEEDNLLTAMYSEEVTQETTNLEIDPIIMFGLITSMVPFANHDQGSRLNRGSKTQKQSLGLYAANYHDLLDTDVSILHYPQKPIVRSFIYDNLNFYPSGQNFVVAIMPYEGYNMSDALVINKASIERGFGRSTYFRTYSTTELHYPGNLKDEICIPSKDVVGYRTEENYANLEEDGSVFPEADLSENDVVIGKISPPKFLLEMEEISIAKSKKENSLPVRQGERGKADGVFISVDGDGRRIVQVRVRDNRLLEVGDKLSTTHGQKGVVGMIVPEENLPFAASGVKPDLIFNPHGIPSRMTVGYLIELLAGKTGSLSGKTMDGTAFSERQTVEQLEKTLVDLGFRHDGKETLYDGVTGKPIGAKIFIGNMYYLKLKYMVANKIQVRASGKVTLLTRQPTEGRAKGGALRMGEMEKDALVSHGTSLLLKERFSSDNVIVYICPICGVFGIKDKVKRKDICPICGNSKLEPVEVSYASKLLFEELMAMHLFPHFMLKNKYDRD
jgi:DNA-directed RNA polymerase subunit B'